MNNRVSGRQEWRLHWYVPLVAAIGYSISTFQSYAIGPFIIPLQREFGWTRAEVSSGTALCNIVAAIFMVGLGPVIDRFGPRFVGLIGVALMTGSFALLGTVNGSMTDWWLHWLLIAFAALWVQGTVWTGVVVSRFHAARGIAIAITISGNAAAAAILPPLSTWLMSHYGWRGGFVGIGVIWALILLPILFLFFRGAQDERRADAARGQAAVRDLPGVTVRQGLRMPAFHMLVLAGLCFAFTAIGTVIHFVPILTSYGSSAMAAAGIASLVGIFSIVGRLGTGLLLDRFPAHLVGFAAYLLPVIGASALVLAGEDVAAKMIAAAAFGLTLGAEADILVYLVSGHFGLRSFGTLMSAIFSAITLGTALGPLVAGAMFDMTGSYVTYLLAASIITAASAVMMLGLRCPKPQ